VYSRTKLERSLRNRGSKIRRILIYDTDGSNPYGRELAALLGNIFEVEAFLPAHTDWLPPRMLARCILPSNTPSWLLAQIVRQIHGMAVVAWTTFMKGPTVIVVETRSWYDQLFLAALALLGRRVVVIAHDPVPKRPLSRVDTICQRILWKHATVLVAHSETLAMQITTICGRQSKVVPHMPFSEYAAWARSIAPDAASPSACRFVILGKIRPDKGLNRLPAIFKFVPKEVRKRISISFVGRGDCSAVISELKSLVSIKNMPSARIIGDVEIAQELAKSDVLLAPYSNVSASGTVVLALSRGLRVIAYDAGALAEVVAPDGLAPFGDECGLAKRIVAATKTPCGRSLHRICTWRQSSLRAWLDAIA